MKKYIIKNADGSEQSEMQAIHESRKEAGETLMDYICDHNEDLDVDDDDYLSPFDFALEEVECKEVNEVITDFESARKALGGKPNADFTVAKKILSGNVVQLEDVARLVTDINPKHIEALIALNKLFTIAQAWNKEDGFVPDFSDLEQDKWFPWFVYDKDAAGFVYADTHYTPTYAVAAAYRFSALLQIVRARRAIRQAIRRPLQQGFLVMCFTIKQSSNEQQDNGQGYCQPNPA